MARKLATKKGRAVYARRKVIVEPVFGQMHTLQNAKYLLLRGLDGAKGEWLLLSACHNLRKLHNHIGNDGLSPQNRLNRGVGNPCAVRVVSHSPRSARGRPKDGNQTTKVPAPIDTQSASPRPPEPLQTRAPR